jgi:hypothetical protein
MVRITEIGFFLCLSLFFSFLLENQTTAQKENKSLRLPTNYAGAAMCAYAVDINGALVDGVVIEKEKARVVFEAEARKVTEKPQVSIAEAVVGNIFKTRIFPLPKDGTRAVRVSYVEELLVSKEYDIPPVFAVSLLTTQPPLS